ncbi:MAG: ethylbenzene dehydrogenase-related protein [Kiloniellales bacterium]
MLRHRLSVLALALAAAPAALAQDVLVSPRVAEGLPLDPDAALWERAPRITVELAAQAITTPVATEDSVSEITAQSLNDGVEIAFRLTWTDPAADRFQTVGRFSDAVAVQIPYRPSDEVPVTMGGEGERVLILHWAAFRQENIEHGFADVAKLHPNYAYDWYPHAAPPYRYPADWHNQYALNYIGGEKVFRKNTLKTPVREVVAEGFGSSTWKDVQRAEGTGVHRDGRWQVVIKRRFNEENTSNPDWGAGRQTFVTFAVWDGARHQRGARKSLGYAWITLKIEGS